MSTNLKGIKVCGPMILGLAISCGAQQPAFDENLQKSEEANVDDANSIGDPNRPTPGLSGGKIGDGGGKPKDSNQGPPSDDAIKPPKTGEEVAVSCQNATLSSDVQTVVFEKYQGSCEWNQNDNLSQVDGLFRARKEHKREIILPENAVICDMQFEFNDLSSMRYDDLMFFTVNDVLVTATEDYTFNFSNKQGDLVFYDWMELRDKPFDTIPGLSTYCLGTGSVCEIPDHDVAGPMSISLSEDTIYDLSAQVLKDGNLNFSWIITGDNDGSDCRHDQDVSLEIAISYY